MPSTDKNPKPKTNEEIEAYMRKAVAGTRPTKPCTDGMLERRLSHTKPFEFRTNFQDTEHIFQAMFLDGAGRKVLAASPNEAPARAKAIASLIDDKCFPSVEAWVVACRNALGDDIDSFVLAGAIFVDGECVDELLDFLLNAPASPAEDKTDSKAPASPVEVKTEKTDKTDDKEVVEVVSSADEKSDEEPEPTDEQIATAKVQYIKFFCECEQHHEHHAILQTVSS